MVIVQTIIRLNCCSVNLTVWHLSKSLGIDLAPASLLLMVALVCPLQYKCTMLRFHWTIRSLYILVSNIGYLCVQFEVIRVIVEPIKIKMHSEIMARLAWSHRNLFLGAKFQQFLFFTLFCLL